jgi:hypothetical protein
MVKKLVLNIVMTTAAFSLIGSQANARDISVRVDGQVYQCNGGGGGDIQVIDSYCTCSLENTGGKYCGAYNFDTTQGVITIHKILSNGTTQENVLFRDPKTSDAYQTCSKSNADGAVMNACENKMATLSACKK